MYDELLAVLIAAFPVSVQAQSESSAASATALLAQDDAAAEDARLIAMLKRSIPQTMRRHGTPGLNIALARHGKVIWEEGFGLADLDAGKPMTKDTVLRSGSMGKTYTATAVMRLSDQGLIEIVDPINDYLKGFQVVNPLGEREVTFLDLLTHRSGLGGNAAGCSFSRPKPLGEHLTLEYPKKFFWSYGELTLPRWTSRAGERFMYSNFGMATLGYLVEAINEDGLTFSEYVQENILDPLGMSSSQYPPVQDEEHIRPEIFERLSKGYARFGRFYLPTPTIYFSDYPAGAMVTTPGDHIRLLLAYHEGGTFDGYKLLEESTVKKMLSPKADPFLGLVWFLENVGQWNSSFGHGGAHMYGWMNHFACYPKQDFAVVVATNQWVMHGGRSSEVTEIPGMISKFLSNPDRVQPSTDEPLAPVPTYVCCDVKTSVPGSPSWKRSYVVGLVVAERLKGSLGIKDSLDAAMVQKMAGGVRVRTEPGEEALEWDPDGFRAGVNDMLSAEMTPTAIAAFLASDRVRVNQKEMQSIGRELGGDGAPRFGVIQ